jgi:hypothetical protein
VTIAPNPNGNDIYSRLPWIPNWFDLNLMVPFIATVIVLAVGILVICVAYNRRRPDTARNSKDVYCNAGDFWDDDGCFFGILRLTLCLSFL